MSNPISGALIKSGLTISRKIVPIVTDPIESQTRTLRNLLKKAAQTKFGQYYNFSKIIRKEDLISSYQQQVPIYEYDTIFDQWWSRTLDGEEDVAWKGKINYYALSSGTTGAPSKFIPISREMIKSIRLAGVKAYSCLTITDLPLQQYSKKMLLLGGSTNLKKGDSYYYGDLSGILMHKLPVWMARRYKPGIRIAAIDDYHEKMLAIAKEAPKWDIGFLSGIPSWITLMLEYVIDYNKLNNVSEIWPNLNVFAHGGISLNPYKDSMEKLIGKPIIYLDNYLASEGFIAFQSSIDAPGMELNYNCGLFFEFVPFNRDNFDQTGNIKSDAKALSIHEIEEGVNYAILISTCAGAWRYLIGDTVKFIDKKNSQLVITGRTKHFLSICGEHLSVENMNDALKEVQKNLNLSIREFTVYGVKKGSHYALKWYLSTEPYTFDSDNIKRELDKQLKKLNDDYAAVRKAVMESPEVITLHPNVFYKYLESKGKLGGQSKIPRVMQNNQIEDWEGFIEKYNK
jgi:hypothetical protein